MITSQTSRMSLGAAAAANPAGAEAALSIMRLGGNAVDAALAAAHVMGVVAVSYTHLTLPTRTVV